MNDKERFRQCAVVCVCTSDFYWQFELLAKSVRKYCSCSIVLCIADEFPIQPFSRELVDAVYTVEDIAGDEANVICQMYTGVELCCVLKPYMLVHSLDIYTRCIYIDTDILIYRNLSDLFEMLEDSDVVLFPHRLQMNNQSLQDVITNANIVQSGYFNAGIIAASRLGIPAINHWKKVIFLTCVSDIARGIFLDQSWLPSVFASESRVRVCTDPGHNIAYWNAHERQAMLTKCSHGIISSIHFSGFTLELYRKGRASKYSNESISEYFLHFYGEYAILVEEAILGCRVGACSLRSSEYRPNLRLSLLIAANNDDMRFDSPELAIDENIVHGLLLDHHRSERENHIKVLSEESTRLLLCAVFANLSRRCIRVVNVFKRLLLLGERR